MESCPTQAVLPLVGLTAEKVFRHRYSSEKWHFPVKGFGRRRVFSGREMIQFVTPQSPNTRPSFILRRRHGDNDLTDMLTLSGVSLLPLNG
ncbi:MAG: hypothetical protein ACQESR_13240 [Planctomycetota bacterium]